MNQDLFGNKSPNIDVAQQELENYDRDTFELRLARLKHINKIFPFGQREYGSEESIIMFNEAMHSYIFGQFISTIILSISFIERRFQEYHHTRFDNRYKGTLNEILKDFRNSGFLDDYFIEKTNKLRLKRNPFVHLRDVNHVDSLHARSTMKSKNSLNVLETDAKEAIDLMLIISKLRIL